MQSTVLDWLIFFFFFWWSPNSNQPSFSKTQLSSRQRKKKEKYSFVQRLLWSTKQSVHKSDIVSAHDPPKLHQHIARGFKFILLHIDNESSLSAFFFFFFFSTAILVDCEFGPVKALRYLQDHNNYSTWSVPEISSVTWPITCHSSMPYFPRERQGRSKSNCGTHDRHDDEFVRCVSRHFSFLATPRHPSHVNKRGKNGKRSWRTGITQLQHWETGLSKGRICFTST